MIESLGSLPTSCGGALWSLTEFIVRRVWFIELLFFAASGGHESCEVFFSSSIFSNVSNIFQKTYLKWISLMSCSIIGRCCCCRRISEQGCHVVELVELSKLVVKCFVDGVLIFCLRWFLSYTCLPKMKTKHFTNFIIVVIFTFIVCVVLRRLSVCRSIFSTAKQ